MAETLESILARKNQAPAPQAGGQTLEQIMAAKNPRKETYPFGPDPGPYVSEKSKFSGRPQGYETAESIVKFLTDIYAAGKFGSIGESLGKRAIRKLPAVGKFLGRTTGFAVEGMASQAVQGQEIDPKAAIGSAVFGASAEKVLQGIGAGLSRAGKVPRQVVQGTLEKPTAGRIGEMFGGAEPEEFLAEARRVGGGVKKALTTKSAGRVEAESMIKTADQLVPHGVSADPIKQKILSLKNPQATLGPAKALNEHLDEIAASIPNRLKYSELDNLVRELAEPVRTQMGNIEMRLPMQTRKRILDFARAYRNKELPGAAASFKKAEKYIGSTKEVYKMIFDNKGGLRPNAPDLWRKAIQKPQMREALQQFDMTTDGVYNATDEGMRLARKAYWTPDDGETAEGLLLAGIGWFGRASLFLGRGAGKVGIAASRPAGATSSVAARMAFEEAMRPQTRPAQVNIDPYGNHNSPTDPRNNP